MKTFEIILQILFLRIQKNRAVGWMRLYWLETNPRKAMLWMREERKSWTRESPWSLSIDLFGSLESLGNSEDLSNLQIWLQELPSENILQTEFCKIKIKKKILNIKLSSKVDVWVMSYFIECYHSHLPVFLSVTEETALLWMFWDSLKKA